MIILSILTTAVLEELRDSGVNVQGGFINHHNVVCDSINKDIAILTRIKGSESEDNHHA